MSDMFRVGVTPDFYVDAQGRFEAAVEQKLSGVVGLEWGAMPAQPGKLATAEAIDQYDAIFSLALKYDESSLQGIERLALIARWGVGYDMIDVKAITEAGVMLAITPNAVRRPVAEAIVAFIFMLAKNALLQDRVTRKGKWRGDLPALGTCLPGRVLGSLGCGNIAQEMFRLCSGLGFSRFLAHDPHANADAAKALHVELVSLEELFRQSDYLAVNCLLNDATRGMVNERLLRLMKPSAYLINTARGAIIDEGALVRALEQHWIAGAGIDVFEQEPPRKDHPLFALDNVILAPHALAWTEEIARDNGLEACDNILSLFRGEIPHGVVNRGVIDNPKFQAKLAKWRGR